MNNSLRFDDLDKESPISRQNMRRLETLLLDGDPHSKDEIASFLENRKMSLRNIQLVINKLNHVYNKQNRIFALKGIGYKLENTVNLAFPEIFFHAEDRKIIHTLYKIILAFDGLPVDKLLEGIGISTDTISKHFQGKIAIESNRYIQIWITSIYKSIVGKQVTDITYKERGGKKHIKTISPYYLKCFNNRWYLIAHIHNKGFSYSWSTFPLDAIIEYKETISKYQYREINIKQIIDYYEPVIGIFVPVKNLENPSYELKASQHKPLDILIKVKSSKTWTYIISNPIHDRQKVDPVNMTVRLHVIENPHLYQKILSYGMYIEVLSPQIVRDELKKITQEMVEIYKTK